jgi:hypothetical protein
LWRGDHSPAAHGDGGKEIALALVVLVLTIAHLVIALSTGASLGQGEAACCAAAGRSIRADTVSPSRVVSACPS